MRQAWPHAVCLDTALNRLAGDEGDIAVLSVDVGGGQGSGAVGGDAGRRGGVLGVVEGARSVLRGGRVQAVAVGVVAGSEEEVAVVQALQDAGYCLASRVCPGGWGGRQGALPSSCQDPSAWKLAEHAAAGGHAAGGCGGERSALLFLRRNAGVEAARPRGWLPPPTRAGSEDLRLARIEAVLREYLEMHAAMLEAEGSGAGQGRYLVLKSGHGLGNTMIEEVLPDLHACMHAC